MGNYNPALADRMNEHMVRAGDTNKLVPLRLEPADDRPTVPVHETPTKSRVSLRGSPALSRSAYRAAL